MLLRDHGISRLRIELSSHEVLVRVQVLIEVDDLFNRYGVWAPTHCLFSEATSFVFGTTWLHGQMSV